MISVAYKSQGVEFLMETFFGLTKIQIYNNNCIINEEQLYWAIQTTWNRSYKITAWNSPYIRLELSFF